MDGDIHELSLTALVDALASKRISPKEAFDAFRARHAAFRSLNAFTQFADALPESAPTDLGGPLAGAPLAIKDNIDVLGFRTTAATPALTELRPQSDAPVIATLRRAGALFLGKTNMHELSFGATSINRHTGPVRNPANPDLIAGGSSGGSAAAVAAGLAPAALGTDTGGSCRIPAALCGIVGYRPSNGRYSNAGVVPLSLTRDTIGLLTRSVEDAVLLDSAITGERRNFQAATLMGLRLGIPDAATMAECSPDVADNFEDLLGALSTAGVTFARLNLSRLHDLNRQLTRPLIAYEVARDLSIYLMRHRSHLTARDVFEQVAGETEGSRLLSTITTEPVENSAYQDVIARVLPALRAGYVAAFDKDAIDAILQPTTLLAAQPISMGETADIDGRKSPAFAAYTRLTDAPSNAGLACISIPIRQRTAPLGVELQCRNGDDQRLFAIALGIETLLRARA